MFTLILPELTVTKAGLRIAHPAATLLVPRETLCCPLHSESFFGQYEPRKHPLQSILRGLDRVLHLGPTAQLGGLPSAIVPGQSSLFCQRPFHPHRPDGSAGITFANEICSLYVG